MKRTTKKSVKSKKSLPKKKSAKKSPKPKARARERPAPGAQRGLRSYDPPDLSEIDLGPDSGGQSGDIEGLPRRSSADSQSVAELLEEGQSFEAGVISGVENAANADESEVTTREVPEDDVPLEYLDQ